MNDSVESTVRRSTLMMLLFWFALAGLLYAGFSYWEQRQRAALTPYADSGGALVIPRQRDGHFYVDGEVNHQPVRFLVDTGASSVAVTRALAHDAQLPKGHAITLQTANGTRQGQIVHGVPVRAGTLARNDVTVTVGISGPQDNAALLGQSFLRHFDVQIAQDQMTLRPRPPDSPTRDNADRDAPDRE